MVLQSRADIPGNGLLAQIHGMQLGIVNGILIDAGLRCLADCQIQIF